MKRIKYVYFIHFFSALFHHKKVARYGIPKTLETSKSDLYTEEEKRVLLVTSKINNIEYVPFMDVDLLER